MNDRKQSVLDQLPREATPRRDLWPEIAARMAPTGRSGRAGRRLAAAAAIFLAGVATGLVAGGSAPEPTGVAEASGVPLHAAAAVQEAGSAYLTALGQLPARTAGDALARSQGTEAALVVLATAASELASAPGLHGATSSLVVDAENARQRAARRVRRLIGEGR